MNYQPIENYGIIGDLNTVALVGLNGSIDFMCFPNFDSPSVFAAMLDFSNGGSFCISPKLDNVKNKQLYIPDTNVLLTRFLSFDGVGEITDFMPVEELLKGHILIRRVTAVRGELTFTMNCSPRFNYARSGHSTEISNNVVYFRSQGEDKTALRLLSTVNLKVRNGDGFAEFRLKTGETADFILQFVRKSTIEIDDIKQFITENLYETMNYWKDWIAESKYTGRWQEIVNRSTLVLKLMTSCRYGSLVASPTFSLPEFIGGERNWDYRYTWIRDASFTIYTMINLGYTKEAGAFMKWVEKECQDIGNAGYLGLMHTISGENTPEEMVLQNMEGYKKSSPVRIGNNAYKQVQLDIYGELMDAVYLYNKYGEPISYSFWNDLVNQINWLLDNWQKEDEGIWEVRGGKRHFLYSRLMCWVALDRAIKLANMRSFPLPGRWVEERNKIFNSIFNDFWNDKLKAFVQYKGADTVDAAALLMPLMRFISSKDPMWLSTLKEIEKELVSDSLVFRYRHKEAAADGLKSGEGTFSMCTFWYIECLSRAGQLQKARLYFEKMIGYANHLGLYAEQLGFQAEHLGNFPQAFTHLGLISAAINLNSQLNDQRNKQNPNYD
ncbi:MAG: glycoside hydrolase family 15 protein [Ignavibacteria bacterium]|jgi:GH15 family glucan-1,4-alpha-glucosidase|nr:glycoside hydrolase family 15 protein [Ignavibacteria bacterium]MCU7504976.1 glycoside hydrolase family 15 protein [Ignavibacteria bacterium]MCU7514890.1 glycoside hydrolase family 15 protein [Ignavibacteria bacterium]